MEKKKKKKPFSNWGLMDFNSSIKNNQNHDSTISEKKKKVKEHLA